MVKMNCDTLENKISFFQEGILDWHKVNGRKFEWRKKSTTNYGYIIAEIFLQRTKANTADRFFKAFIKKYPSWYKLSLASKEELQNELRPIGLYRQRGEKLYSLTQMLVSRGGRLPKTLSEASELPMFGQYIQNAFVLFVLGQPAPLLDVNMARVLERFFGKRTKADIRYDPYLQKLSHDVVSHKAMREINWGILDFAALICNIKAPSCSNCPLNSQCLFYSQIST